jgi:hypothetical protein
MADTIHSILFAYPPLTGLVVALIVLALIIYALRRYESRPHNEPSEIDGLHSAPDNVERRAGRAF